jgi:hypothetical protein
VKLRLTIANAQALARRWQRRQRNLERMDAATMRTLLRLRAAISDNIYAQGAFSGDTWPPLAERTLRDRVAQGYGTAPLIRTGLLKDGWQANVHNGRGTLTALAPYARDHQEGTARVPRRAFLPQHSATIEIVLAEFREHIRASLSDD